MITASRYFDAVAVWIIDEQELLAIVSSSDTFDDFDVGIA